MSLRFVLWCTPRFWEAPIVPIFHMLSQVSFGLIGKYNRLTPSETFFAKSPFGQIKLNVSLFLQHSQIQTLTPSTTYFQFHSRPAPTTRHHRFAASSPGRRGRLAPTVHVDPPLFHLTAATHLGWVQSTIHP